ncbi:MAG: hypothetical protein M3512_13070 [Bacteroidota bacterium]|nr:hypothetical protein [Bacteroidota bacterium]
MVLFLNSEKKRSGAVGIFDDSYATTKKRLENSFCNQCIQFTQQTNYNLTLYSHDLWKEWGIEEKELSLTPPSQKWRFIGLLDFRRPTSLKRLTLMYPVWK